MPLWKSDATRQDLSCRRQCGGPQPTLAGQRPLLSTLALALSEEQDDATVRNEEVDALRTGLDGRGLAGPALMDLESFHEVGIEAAKKRSKVDGEVAARKYTACPCLAAVPNQSPSCL